jgi:hypothetical protein
MRTHMSTTSIISTSTHPTIRRASRTAIRIGTSVSCTHTGIIRISTIGTDTIDRPGSRPASAGRVGTRVLAVIR